jgi:TPR repeat protein
MLSQCFIVEMCSKRYSKSQDKSETMEWNKKAAELLNVEAMFYWGNVFKKGIQNLQANPKQ